MKEWMAFIKKTGQSLSSVILTKLMAMIMKESQVCTDIFFMSGKLD